MTANQDPAQDPGPAQQGAQETGGSSHGFPPDPSPGEIPTVGSVSQLLARFTAISGDAFLVYDPQVRAFLDCNRTAHERLGYEREAFLRLRPEQFQADPEHDAAWVGEISRRMLSQPRGSFPTRHRSARGEERDVLVAYQSVTFGERPLVLIAIRDRTEVVLAERERSRLIGLLNEAERISRLGSWELIHASGDLVWSEEFYRILEIAPQTAAPSWRAFLARVPPQERERVKRTLRHALHTGGSYRLEHRLQLDDGLMKVVQHHGQTTFDRHGKALLTLGTVQDISELHAAHLRLEQAAYLDRLTGLPNKAATLRHLASLLQEADPAELALVDLDLDGFQQVNESFGRKIGDRLLIATGEHLTSQLREGDWLARVGGDEFVLVRRQAGMALDRALLWAESLRQALNRPSSTIPGQPLRTSVCLGVSVGGEGIEDPGSLLQQANSALMEAKRSGRNQLRGYTPELRRLLRERLALEHRLAKALERDQLNLVFQPQLDDRGAVIGAEALLRWRLEEGPEVSPALFVPLAERAGLMPSLGSWVLEEGCRQLGTWLRQGLTLPRLALNLSATQFSGEGPSLVEQVKGALNRHALPGEVIELELTETSLLVNPEQAQNQLTELGEAGCSVAIDDFGTGYSSMVQLRSLPLNKLKIERCFVSCLGEANQDTDRAIVRATISMARDLGLHSLAEGVETITQLEALKALGCKQFQGFYFGRPMEAAAFEGWMAGRAA